jgi:hypothetical protein
MYNTTYVKFRSKTPFVPCLYKHTHTGKTLKLSKVTRPWWLTPVILLRRQRSGGLRFEASLGKYFARSYLENIQHKKGLAAWLKW